METYTNIKIEMENNEVAIKAVKKAKSAIRESKAYRKDEKNVSRFMEDITASDNMVIVNDSCTLDSEEYNNFMSQIYKAIASLNEVKSFEGKSHFSSSNCGYEADANASYWNGTLTIESIAAEDFWGCCDECGEIIVHYTEYDPSKTYTCTDCGRVLTEKDLFPDGLPEVEVECYEI